MSRRESSTPESSERAAVYRAAAQWLEYRDLEGCCRAICKSLPQGHGLHVCSPYGKAFEKVFRHDNAAYYMGELSEENRGVRIVALCFMAAMVEAGDA